MTYRYHQTIPPKVQGRHLLGLRQIVTLMTRFIALMILLFIATDATAQADSSATDRSGFYNALRLGVGLEKSPYLELGYSRIGIADKGWGGSVGFYVAGQVSVAERQENSRYLYGAKVGCETAWMIGMLGAEIKYLTDRARSQVYFTPKVGLSAVGFMSILYGYNIPKDDDLAEIGSHQISITLNWSRKLIRDFK